MKPSWGLPEVWKQCRAKDTKERKGTALGCTISKITLCSGSQNFGRGCSLGSHISVFQRHRWALAFLIIQTDPDFRAAGKWDLARIQLGKNHITTTTKKNKHQNKTKPIRQAFWTLIGTECMRTSSMFPSPARAGMSQGIISITQQLPRLQSSYGDGQGVCLAPAPGVPTFWNHTPQLLGGERNPGKGSTCSTGQLCFSKWERTGERRKLWEWMAGSPRESLS